MLKHKNSCLTKINPDFWRCTPDLNLGFNTDTRVLEHIKKIFHEIVHLTLNVRETINTNIKNATALAT